MTDVQCPGQADNLVISSSPAPYLPPQIGSVPSHRQDCADTPDTYAADRHMIEICLSTIFMAIFLERSPRICRDICMPGVSTSPVAMKLNTASATSAQRPMRLPRHDRAMTDPGIQSGSATSMSEMLSVERFLVRWHVFVMSCFVSGP